LAALLLALPFLAVTFPPITDLPQQTAQVRLFADAVTDSGSPYRVQWLTPYGLSYGVLGLAWALFGPVHAGRVAMVLIGCLWVGAAFLVARRRGRPPEAVLLAALLFFNHVVTWGFYSFALGLPLFLLWLLVTTRDPRRVSPWEDALACFAGGLALYLTHALWFAAGVLWLGAWGLAHRGPWTALVRRGLALAPVAVLAAVWFMGISGTPFGTEPRWFTLPWQRLAPAALTEATLGILRGPWEGLVFGALLLWLLAAAWQGRRSGAGGADRVLLSAAALLFALYLGLPDKYTNTIQFSQRFLPPAVALALLAAPPLSPRWLPRVVAPLLLAAHAVVVTGVWRGFETHELSGLRPSLEALPPEPRVLGLDYLRQSPRVDGLPFLQLFAYTQVWKGGEVNFTFALFPTSLVVFDPVPEQPWSGGLEWYPERVQTADFQHFSHVLVGAPPELQRQFERAPFLEPVQRQGLWRLYRVVSPQRP
jgi:hypothetical protein